MSNCASLARGAAALNGDVDIELVCHLREFERLASGFDRDFEILKSGGRTAELKLAETVFDEADVAGGDAAAEAALERVPRAPIERDLEIVVALERKPRLAPRPRLADGRVAEHLYGFSAGDRRALGVALALKRAEPDHVALTLICAAAPAAEDGLRFSRSIWSGSSADRSNNSSFSMPRIPFRLP